MRPRARTLLLTAALLAAAPAGCSAPTHPHPPATPGPVRAAAAIPAGMERYRFGAEQLTVTLGTGRAAGTRLARVVDALARYPLTLTSAANGARQPVLTATWVRPSTPAEVRAATAAVHRADPAALSATGTVDLVGVRWQATLPAAAGPTFARDLQTRLAASVDGRYTVDVHGRGVTVTWVAPGLTRDGLAAVTTALAAQAGLPAAQVHVSALG